jgi:hypothetical protein
MAEKRPAPPKGGKKVKRVSDKGHQEKIKQRVLREQGKRKK